MQSSSKFILPNSLSKGIDFQIPKRLFDMLYLPILALGFQNSEGFGRKGVFHHDHDFDANIAMKIAILD